MKCPTCTLENPDNSLRCDCGHVFAGTPDALQVARLLMSIDRSLRIIKVITLIWLGCAILGFALWILARNW
jgi:hypothetical protein